MQSQRGLRDRIENSSASVGARWLDRPEFDGIVLRILLMNMDRDALLVSECSILSLTISHKDLPSLTL